MNRPSGVARLTRLAAQRLGCYNGGMTVTHLEFTLCEETLLLFRRVGALLAACRTLIIADPHLWPPPFAPTLPVSEARRQPSCSIG